MPRSVIASTYYVSLYSYDTQSETPEIVIPKPRKSARRKNRIISDDEIEDVIHDDSPALVVSRRRSTLNLAPAERTMRTKLTKATTKQAPRNKTPATALEHETPADIERSAEAAADLLSLTNKTLASAATGDEIAPLDPISERLASTSLADGEHGALRTLLLFCAYDTSGAYRKHLRFRRQT